MWNLNFEAIENCLAGESERPRVAIETGTCRGNGTRALASRFERVITVELSEPLFRSTCSSLSGPRFSHVEFLHGNSATLMPGILRSLPANEPVFIFLDAHWSGDQTVNWEKAAWKGFGVETAHLAASGHRPTGPEQCPLAEELRVIVENCKGPAHILIDDLKNIPVNGPGLRDHEFPGEDWSHLSRELLRSIVQPRLRKLHELENPAQWLLTLSALTIRASETDKSNPIPESK